MANSDAYMELSDPSVWGETYDEQFGMGPQGRRLGAFEISHFEFSVSTDTDSQDGSTNKSTTTPAPTKTSSKQKDTALQNFSITKFIDKGSPDLFLSCLKKTKIDWAIITIRESGEESRKPYLVLEFRGLHVASFKWDLNPGDTESASAMETVEFDFESILIKYSRQEVTGEHKVVKIKGWNRLLQNDQVSEIPWDQLQPQAQEQ